MRLKRVVFPTPDLPIIDTISPLFTCKLISKIFKLLNDLFKFNF